MGDMPYDPVLITAVESYGCYPVHRCFRAFNVFHERHTKSKGIFTCCVNGYQYAFTWGRGNGRIYKGHRCRCSLVHSVHGGQYSGHQQKAAMNSSLKTEHTSVNSFARNSLPLPSHPRRGI